MRVAINKRLVESLKPADKPYEVRDTKLKGFILRVQPSGVMTYICQYGRGKRINIGYTSVLTPTQARERAKGILADVVKGIDPQEDKRKTKAHTLESYILNVYEPWVKTHHKNADATIKRLKANFLPILGKVKLGDITAWNVEKWRSDKIKAGAKASTVNRDLNPLKAALSRAAQWGFINANPLTSIKPIRVDSKAIIRYLSDNEEERLRTALDSREERIRLERDSANNWRRVRGYKLLPNLRKPPFADYLKPLIILDLNTGLRRGELFNLKWNDVDRAMLTVKGEGAKTGQTRHVPLNQEAYSVLYQWKTQSQDNKLVFPGKGGGRLTNVNNSWRKLLKDANITDFRFHDMRHHFASRLVMAGVDLNTVRELLGHADIKMTLRYSHLSPQVKQAAVDKLVKGKIRETQNLKKTMITV